MYPYVLAISLFINGHWMDGKDVDGWGSRPQPSLATCKERQSDLHDWFRRMGGHFDTPYGRANGIVSYCYEAGRFNKSS